MRAVLGMHEAAKSSNPGDRPLCLTCDNEFTTNMPPFYIVLMSAMRDDPTKMAVNGLCPECIARLTGENGLDKDGLRRSVLDAYRRLLVPDMREIMMHPGEGRA